jgi:hypothetical protein
MFGTANFDHTGVETYADALAYFERAKPWRGETAITAERPMEHRRHRNYGVRNNGGVIRFRMHQTNVVSYHPDGTIEFDVWSSKTTDSFVNSLVGRSISSHFTSGYIVVDGMAYRAVNTVTIRPDRTVVTTEKWSKYVVDRKAFNRTVKEFMPEFHDAVAWFKAAAALGSLPTDPHSDVLHWRHSLMERTRQLRDRSNWKHLTDDKIQDLRKAHTRMHALVPTDPVNGIPTFEIESYRAAWRKWGQP